MKSEQTLLMMQFISILGAPQYWKNTGQTHFVLSFAAKVGNWTKATTPEATDIIDLEVEEAEDFPQDITIKGSPIPIDNNAKSQTKT